MANPEKWTLRRIVAASLGSKKLVLMPSHQGHGPLARLGGRLPRRATGKRSVPGRRRLVA
jgi:hypothetical protein